MVQAESSCWVMNTGIRTPCSNLALHGSQRKSEVRIFKKSSLWLELRRVYADNEPGGGLRNPAWPLTSCVTPRQLVIHSFSRVGSFICEMGIVI